MGNLAWTGVEGEVRKDFPEEVTFEWRPEG